jgi:hypothetical protein
MKRQAAYSAMVIGVLLIAYNVVDRVEQHTEAQVAAARAEAMDGCWPAAGETAIIVSNGRLARCRILSTASTSTGMAPRLISAAVVEVGP